MYRGVVRIEDSRPVGVDAQHRRQDQVDHAAVADHGDRLARVGADEPLDRDRDPLLELVAGVVACPRLAGQVVEAGVTLGLQLLDRDVFRRVAIELGDIVHDRRCHAECPLERRRRLTRSDERARVDGVDVLRAEIRRQQFGLAVSVRRELRVGDAGRQLLALRQGVSHHDEFHAC